VTRIAKRSDPLAPSVLDGDVFTPQFLRGLARFGGARVSLNETRTEGPRRAAETTMHSNQMEVLVDRAERGWMVRVVGSATVQCFSCATEDMAQKFASVFERALHPVAQAA
jgi:hypothetical protein